MVAVAGVWGNAEEQRNEKAGAEVECETPSERRKTLEGVTKMERERENADTWITGTRRYARENRF